MSGGLILVIILSAVMLALTIIKFEDNVVKAKKSFKELTISKKLSVTMPLILTFIMWVAIGFNHLYIIDQNSKLLKAFNNNQTLQCGINKMYGFRVNKKKGWSYSESEKIFIKDELYINQDLCKIINKEN